MFKRIKFLKYFVILNLGTVFAKILNIALKLPSKQLSLIFQGVKS